MPFDWLSLLDVSGPFLTIPVVRKYLPELDRVDTATVADLRQAFTAREGKGVERSKDFVLFVLQNTLGYDDSVFMPGAELCIDLREGGKLQPDYLLKTPEPLDVFPDEEEPETGPALLISIYTDTALDKPLKGSPAWSPQRRMEELCRAANVPLGLVTNGEQFTLVYARRNKTSSFITWHASLWLEERVTLQSFITLLHKRRFFSVAIDESLPSLMEHSANAQQDVTEKLGLQVRSAVTEFLRAIDRLARLERANGEKSSKPVLSELPPAYLYQAALTVMMRLVFLLTAEERGLLQLGHPLYDENYAVSTLCATLRATADKFGEETLASRHDAWVRLLSLFRAVHSGSRHADLNIPTYGGSLFDPDAFPFLEGRPQGSCWKNTYSDPLPVSNRVVLHMLESLQYLRDRQTTGLDEAVRLSFRGLDVEQIGHVYEGLLDRTACKADQVLLGLLGKNEVFLPLSEAENLLAENEDVLIASLRKLTGSSENALKKLLHAENKQDERLLASQLLIVCDGDEQLVKRIWPFVRLLRLDSFGFPVVVLQDSLYVTAGSQRRDTGTHYTPRPLTETLVAATLEPHVYDGPAQGLPKEQWRLKSSEQLLDLKICDMAMGSGAFLVQACRYLSEKILEAWEKEQKQDLPQDAEEKQIYARRLITDRCLYGVDNNPLAVEMAKLSLWLITMRKHMPFTFLDHALRCGDALLGITDARQLEKFSLLPEKQTELVWGMDDLKKSVADAVQKRTDLENIASDSILDVERKTALLADAEQVTAKLRGLADGLVMATVKGRGKLSQTERYKTLNALYAAGGEQHTENMQQWLEEQRQLEIINGSGKAKAEKDADNNPGFTRPLHWILEFPEVFNRKNPGFDAIVGNPPFLGSQHMRNALGNFYREYLIAVLGSDIRGKSDLVAYFFLRAAQLIRRSGDFGLIATNTIAQGDTRTAGLLQIEQKKYVIRAAWPNILWEGNAKVYTSQVVIRHSTDWPGEVLLGNEQVDTISSFLTATREEWKIEPLKENLGIAFQGSMVLGERLVITEEQAHKWIEEDKSNTDILFPYLNSRELTKDPQQRPSRWVINFYDWPEDKASTYRQVFKFVKDRKITKGKTIENHKKFWQFWRPRSECYHAIGRGGAFVDHSDFPTKNSPLSRIIVIGGVSKYGALVFIPNTYILSNALMIFASEDAALFGILQSSIHNEWARKMGSTLKTDLRYTPDIAFASFPRPASENLDEVRNHAETLHADRAEIMRREQIGLTELYNNLHNPDSTIKGIDDLRSSHAKLDELVAAAYGWSDLNVTHDFRQVDYLPKNDRLRHTIPEETRLEILRRLAALNKERWQAEQAAQPVRKRKKA